VLSGFNDSGTLYPELTKEWHPTKNKKLKPTDILSRSAKKVWWICKCGHEWKADLHSRTAGNGCPYCSGKKMLEGFNDLATTHPELAKQWHPTKNGDIKPTNITANSNKEIWWMCECGHEWQTKPNNRMRARGCPYCAGKKAIKGKTDLATTHPELAQQWHPTKNGDIKPTDIMAGTHKKFWWINDKGEEQFTSPNSKARKYRKSKPPST
jgi:DNA-directed RNA polymerase subunit RPC12/RpoP